MIEFLADPFTMMMISLGATAAGTGVSLIGQSQKAAADAAAARATADLQNKEAQIATTNAMWDIQAGEVKAQQAGLVSQATLGRILAGAGSRNIAPTTGSTAQAYMSQVAIGREQQNIQRADAAHAAYGEQVQAAEKTTQAGFSLASAQNIMAALPIQQAATIAGGVGQGFSVAAKWYPTAGAGGANAPLDLLDPANTSGYGTLPTPTQQQPSSSAWGT